MLTNESLAHDSLSIAVADPGVDIVGTGAVVELSEVSLEEDVLIDERLGEERLDARWVLRLLTIIGFRNINVASSCNVLCELSQVSLLLTE